jgi:SAM-dependent methyltransferase
MVRGGASMKAITLDGFEQTFAASADPWQTFANRDEALKRQAILHAIGPGPLGRVLELGAGNGSNSVAIAPRARRLDATEATAQGTALVRTAVARYLPRARAIRLAVPAPLPRPCYDVVVVAELLYYLSARAMRRTAIDVAAALRPGGILVLAHHRIDFHDFAQHAEHLQGAFLAATGCRWKVRQVRRTGHWIVLSCRKAR